MIYFTQQHWITINLHGYQGECYPNFASIVIFFIPEKPMIYIDNGNRLCWNEENLQTGYGVNYVPISLQR